MSILDRYDRHVYASDPFILTQCLCGNKSRAQIEYMIVRCCAINPEAFRLVHGLDFSERYLKEKSPRRMWRWLNEPQPLRKPLPQFAFAQMKAEIGRAHV